MTTPVSYPVSGRQPRRRGPRPAPTRPPARRDSRRPADSALRAAAHRARQGRPPFWFAHRLLLVLSGQCPVHTLLAHVRGPAYDRLTALAPSAPLRPRGTDRTAPRGAGGPRHPAAGRCHRGLRAGRHRRPPARPRVPPGMVPGQPLALHRRRTRHPGRWLTAPGHAGGSPRAGHGTGAVGPAAEGRAAPCGTEPVGERPRRGPAPDGVPGRRAAVPRRRTRTGREARHAGKPDTARPGTGSRGAGNPVLSGPGTTGSTGRAAARTRLRGRAPGARPLSRVGMRNAPGRPPDGGRRGRPRGALLPPLCAPSGPCGARRG